MYDKPDYSRLSDAYIKVLSEGGHTQKANIVNQLTQLKRNAEHLMEQVNADLEYPAWWVNKLVKANDYLDTAHDYLNNKVDQNQSPIQKDESVDLEEKVDVKKALSKVKGLDKKAAEMIAALPMPVINSIVNTMSSIMADTVKEDAADAAKLKAKQASEAEKLKDKQEADKESLKSKHERENETQKRKDEAEKASDQAVAAREGFSSFIKEKENENI